MKYAFAFALLFALSNISCSAQNKEEKMNGNIYQFAAKTIDGSEKSLADYKGKVLLIVNVASKCGFTKQYAGLEELYKKYKDQGFEILGFPCNQFGSQEPGSSAEISEFCSLNYGVTFQLFEKIDVNGENQSPIYSYLKNNAKGMVTDDIKWNFTKFLIDQNGNVVDRFAPQTTPESIGKDVGELLGK